MKTTKITKAESDAIKVGSLPTRPNADASYGGYGYTAQDMKAAFDRLPLLIISRLNSLIEDICADEEGIAEDVKTGLSVGHTLKNFFEDMLNGEAAKYMKVGTITLEERIKAIEERLSSYEASTAFGEGEN